jgi:hypothetical protein
MSRILLITIFLVLVAGFVYFSIIDSGVYVEEYSDDTGVVVKNEPGDPSRIPQDTSFYETGDSVICTVGSGAVESIYYFNEGDVRVSGAINGREVNSIYKDGSVYSWAVIEDEIISPMNYNGPSAREDNLLNFGPEDYGQACKPWLEVDKSIFEVPITEFEVINNYN